MLSSKPTLGSQAHAPARKRLPTDRAAGVHEFSVGGFECRLRFSLFPDGALGEIFIDTNKSGSTVSGMLDSFATAISIALQYGVPLEVLADKFIGGRFEPSGVTDNAVINPATSLYDYIFRYLLARFGKETSNDGTIATKTE